MFEIFFNLMLRFLKIFNILESKNKYYFYYLYFINFKIIN